MKPLFKRSLTVVIAALLVCSMIAAGCSDSGAGDASVTPTAAPAALPADTPTDTPSAAPETLESASLIASEAPIDLRIHMHYADSRVYDNDWPVMKEAAAFTNVTLKGTAPQSATNSKEIFNIMLSMGDLPDIIHGEKADLIKAAQDGALLPLDELIEQHAPHIRQFFAEHDWVRKGSQSADGKLYYIPYVLDGQASEGHFIRQDWLDALQLSTPKTVDEYYRVLKAFRENDPNGNSKKDEIPFFSRNTKGVLNLVQLFGAHTGWYVDGNGIVRYGKYEPEYGTAMVNLAKWYAEDLIDKEIFTRGSKARDILLGDDVGGATHDWFGSTASYNDSLKEQIPGFQFVPFAPPADLNGQVKEEKSRALLSTRGWGISASNNHLAETIKYFDFWFTEEGRRLGNFGIEGVHYTMVDGKPLFKDEVLNGSDPVNKQLWDVGAQLEFGIQMDFFYEEQWMNPVAKQGAKLYIDNHYFLPLFPSLSFTIDEQKEITQKWTAIETYIDEMEQKWIMGAEAVEPNYNKYMKTLKDMGMDDIVSIYNHAYQRYNAN